MTHRLVTLLAVQEKDGVRLIDADGKSLCFVKRLLPVTEADGPLLALSWRRAMGRIKGNLESRIHQRIYRTPGSWECALRSMFSSAKQRTRRGCTAKRGVCLTVYDTTTWDEAIYRIYQQGFNKLRRSEQDGWHKWAHSAASNGRKRMAWRSERSDNGA